MTKYVLTATLLVLSLLSCKKDKSIVDDKPGNPWGDHYPSKAGSFWIYEWYSIDSNNVETKMTVVDTVYILGDTLLNGNHYAIYKEPFLGSYQNLSFRRDSSGYIVDQNGTTLYSYVNFNDTFQSGSLPDYLNYYSTMIKNPDKIQVPAGSFSSVELRTTYYDERGIPLTTCGDSLIVTGTYYSPSVGEIKRTTGYFFELQRLCKKMERRLVSYSIP